MKLTLIRHGTTAWNDEARYQGWSDIPLTQIGIREATRLHDHVDLRDVSVVISSDLSRCMETAKLVFPRHVIHTAPGFREMSFGDWEGLTYEQCLQRDSGRYSKWLDAPTEITPPNGESFGEFRHRILHALRAMYETYAESEESSHLAIVTHGGPIRLLFHECVRATGENTLFHTSHIPRIEPCGTVHFRMSFDQDHRFHLTMELMS